MIQARRPEKSEQAEVRRGSEHQGVSKTVSLGPDGARVDFFASSTRKGST